MEDRLAPAAQAIGFTIDPASSTLSLSGTLVTPLVSQSVAPQGAGSLTTSFSGSINTLVDFAASSILFREAGTSVDAAVSGDWSPLQGGGAGAASADYGGQFNALVDTVFVAIRNMIGTLSTAAPLSLTGTGATTNFDSTQQLRFTSGTADFLAPGLLASTIGSGSVSLVNLTAANTAGDGSLEDLGSGSYRLTVPILVSVATDVAPGDTVTLTMQGTIVANATVPIVDLNGSAGGNDFVATFTEDSVPVAVVAATASITSGAADHLSGAKVVLTNHPDGAAESLAINVGASGLTSGYDSATGILTLSGDASLAVYESVLRTLTYANASRNPDAANRVIEITVTDALNPASESLVHQSTVGVVAVNDAPVNHVPGPLVVNHIGTIHFGGGVFSVADADAGVADLQMTLSASAGTLQLDSTAGLIATGSGTGTLTLIGSFAALNAALATLSYTPPVGFVGAAVLTMTTNDQGNSGVGAPGTDSDMVPVTVTNLRPTRLAAFARGIPYTAGAGKPLTVAVRKGLARAFRDFNFDSLSVAVLKAPPASLGTVVVRADGSFTFRAKPAAKGAKVIFKVRAFDGAAFSDPLIVTMTVM